MQKRIGVLLLIICVCNLLFCSCSNPRQEKERPIHVGVLCYDQSDTFISELVNCFSKQFEMDNVDAIVTVYDAADSQRTQDDQVDDLIDANCDVWCVNLVDRTTPSVIIDAAKDNNIPIIFFNREPVSEDMKRWNKLYYVGADGQQSGDLQGQLITEVIHNNPTIDRNNDGKIQYVVLEGELGHQDAIVRTENSSNYIRNSGIELEKLGSGIANWNRAQAQNRMLQLIAQYKNTIELVIANNDEMALGALDAYNKLNYTQSDIPVFFGIDGTKDGLEAVKEGKMSGTVYNDKEGQARAMEKLTVALATDKGLNKISFTNKRYIYLDYYKIDSNNVDEYLKRSESYFKENK